MHNCTCILIQSYKAPTSVLTSAAGEFVAFGYEAEQRYSEALEDDDDERDDLALFRHFKMSLMETEVLSTKEYFCHERLK